MKKITKFFAAVTMMIAGLGFFSCSKGGTTVVPVAPEPVAENALWHSYEGCGIQVWKDWSAACTIDATTGYFYDLGPWFGDSFGAWDENGAAAGYTIDLSEVSYMTFKAKTDTEATNSTGGVITHIYIAPLAGEQQKFTLTDTEETYTVTFTNPTDAETVIFNLGSDESDNYCTGTAFYLYDITFYDADDNEVIPVNN